MTLKKGSGWDLNVFESPWVRWQLSKENFSNPSNSYSSHPGNSESFCSHVELLKVVSWRYSREQVNPTHDDVTRKSKTRSEPLLPLGVASNHPDCDWLRLCTLGYLMMKEDALKASRREVTRGMWFSCPLAAKINCRPKQDQAGQVLAVRLWRDNLARRLSV